MMQKLMDKVVEKKKWLRFEHQSIDFHRKRYNHTVYHQKDAPEDELFKSGFIHDYNKTRLQRLKNKHESRRRSAYKYSDYGMDFLCKDVENNTYHAGQSKCYEKNKVTANHIGTFQSVINNRLKSKGYLYTTSNLEVNLREDLQNNPNSIIHHKLTIDDVDVDGDEDQTMKQEILLELRDYQQECLNALISARSDTEHNRFTVKMFCGGGKTLILGHYLKRCQFKLVICIAPLLVSVDNLLKRILPFIPEYKHLLVDSDVGGTTDPVEISNFLKNDDDDATHKIIFSTFDSSKDILAELTELKTPEEDWCIIVDEVHNMINKDTLCALTNSFNNALLLSATIPEELYDVVDAKECYSYTMDRAIANGYACDYRIFLPYMSEEDKHPVYHIPMEFSNFQDDLAAKAMYLATGMLSKGSRRLIAFMNTQEECVKFLEVLNRVFIDYHAVKFWGAVITSDVPSSKRKEILKTFEEFPLSKTGQITDPYEELDILSNIEIKIIVSVRILDEAVDIPVCDSVFISNIGDNASDIRTMQRVMRAGRIVKNNPNKVNNVFLWCDEWKNAINSLTLFKEQDIEFHKKIGCLSGDYDNQHTHVQKEHNVKQSYELVAYMNIKCLSLEELWEEKLERLNSYVIETGKLPSIHDKDLNIKRMGRWLSNQKQNYAKSQYILKPITIRKKWEEFTNKHSVLFMSKKEKWMKTLGDVEMYILTANKTPTKCHKNSSIKKLGLWLSKQRQNYVKSSEIMNDATIRKEFEEFKRRHPLLFLPNEEIWMNTLGDVEMYIAKLDKLPSKKDIRRWISDQKSNYAKSLYIMKEPIIRRKWEEFTSKHSNLFLSNEESWMNTLSDVKLYVVKNGKIPSSTNKDQKLKQMSSWISKQKQNYEQSKKIMKDPTIRKKWEEFTSEHIQIKRVG